MHTETLVKTLSSLQQVSYSSEQEVEFIWKARWSFPKCLYLVTRYYGVFNLAFYTNVVLSRTVSVNYCKVYVWFDSFSKTIFYLTTVNMLFVLRVYALYERRRSMLIFLLIVVFVEFSTSTIIAVLSLGSITFVERLPGIPILGCVALSVPRLTLVSWIMYLTAACTFYVLMMYRLTRSTEVKDWFNVKLIFSRMHTYPLMTAFYVDGNLFFGIAFLVILLNTVANLVGGVLIGVGGPWLSAVYTVAGSRLVLNLKIQNASHAMPESTLSMHSFSAGTTSAHFGVLPVGLGQDDSEIGSVLLQDRNGDRNMFMATA